MWCAADISLFFSLFGLKKEILDSLQSREFSKTDLDGYSELQWENLLGNNNNDSNHNNNNSCTAQVMYRIWNQVCSFRHCAQDAINQARETLNLWRTYFHQNSPQLTMSSTPILKSSESCPLFSSLDSLPNSVADHFLDLKSTIDQQKGRIQLLEDRELDYHDELKRREQLILDLQNQMIILQDSLETRTIELKQFSEVSDAAHSKLLEETNKLHSLISESTKTFTSLHHAFLENTHFTDHMMDLKYFTPLAFSSNSATLPILEIQKLSCQKLPLSSLDPLYSMNPYIVITLRDASTQTGPLIGARSGKAIEWTPPNQLSHIVSNISIDDLIQIEVWDQYTIHEAHLIAKAEGRVIPVGQVEEWQQGKDCICEITLQFFDEHSSPLDETITLIYSLKNNLFSRSDSASASFATTSSHQTSQEAGITNPSSNNQQTLDRLETIEISFLESIGEKNSFINSFFVSWRLLMKSLLSAQSQCSHTVDSSETLIRTQTTLFENLLTSIKICYEQSNGMKNYALSLHPLVEKLRTEKSYMDLLQETESKYETALQTLQNNYTELDENWKTKYFELETSSQQRFDQYVSESQSRYTTLLESTNKAYADLREAYETSRQEALSLNDQLRESFTRYEKLKLNYEEVCHRLESEVQALGAARIKITSLESELEEIIEIVRKDMAHRCISKNAAEDLLTLSSQMISHDPHSNTSLDIFLHQFDWSAMHLQLSMNMTEHQVIELKSNLATIKNSYDILSSRLFLECQARVELEKILDGTKEELEAIKIQILSEVKVRQQLEEELKFAKELASNESKFALVAKKAAEDAIKQARYYQKKLNKEIDHIRDNINGTDVIGEISLTLPDDASEIPDEGGEGPAVPFSPKNKKNGRQKRGGGGGGGGVSSLEDDFYANLALTPEGKPKRKSHSISSNSQRSRGKILEMEDSPYSEHLPPHARKLIQRGEYSTIGNRSLNSAPGYRKSFSNGLQTNSESGIDTKKKGKKITSMGKKFIKKVQRSFGSRSKSNSTVAPLVDGDERELGRGGGGGAGGGGPRPLWVDPTTKDYSNLKG